jgi:hypothetical protein
MGGTGAIIRGKIGNEYFEPLYFCHLGVSLGLAAHSVLAALHSNPIAAGRARSGYATLGRFSEWRRAHAIASS